MNWRRLTGPTFSRIALAIVILTSANLLFAQEFRATITGRITDPSGAVLPGVTVTAANTQTGEMAVGTTTSEGVYTIPFLRPGLYSVSAELSGFHKVTQANVRLEVGQTAAVNLQLSLGELSEQITVAAESPLLETAKADRGLVIDNERVTELPLNARNPFMLSYLSPGITYNGPAIYQRPFDNGAIADWSINGGQNRNNEFLLDGAPNNAIQGGNNIAYVPPVDAVQEFKIVTNSYDAQYGRTSGGVVNVSLKSGTNLYHGTAYEFARRKGLDSTENYFKVNNLAKPDHKLDQYGFEVDGPLTLGSLYDGRNKTFFMFNFEGYKEATPNPATFTVPDAAQLNGDFSNLRDAQGRLITIYDPATGRLVNGQWVRDPFPNNQIPANRINPVAQQLAQYFLKPNAAAPGGSDPWRNNFVFAPNLAFDTFNNLVTKVDHNFSDRTRMFVRYAYNLRTEDRSTNGITSGPAQDGSKPLQRKNHTGVADWVNTVSSSLVLNVRSGLNQFVQLSRSDEGLSFNPSDLGFPASLANQLPFQTFPRVNFFTTGTTVEYQNLGRQDRNNEVTTIWSVQPNFSWVKGRHDVRGGLDMRVSWLTREINANLFVLSFDRRFTQRLYNQSEALSGNAIASFLLGDASAGAIDNNFFPTYRWNYYAPWAQDDWKVSDRLTVNLGLRWDLNSPVFEQQNQLNAGFDTTTVNPVSANINQQQFPGYQVVGGLGFVDVNGSSKYPYQYDKNNIQPRVGLAYLVGEKTVLRAGYGLYYVNVVGISASNGFAVQTPLITSLDADRTSTAPLSNPFSQGVTAAPGSSQGLQTLLGRNISFSNHDFVNPFVHQFSLGLQHELPWRLTVELSYVGSRTMNEQNRWGGFNEPALSLRDQCDPTKGGSPGFCNELLPNPFFQVPGFEGTARFTSPTLSRYELSRPFPQFGTITMLDRNDGRIWYNSAQLVANKRMSGGVTLNGTYTWSKMIERNGGGENIGSTGVVNPLITEVDRIVQESPYESDRRHRVTVSGVYRLPFGREQKFLSTSGPLVNGLVHGWEVAGMWLFNSGRPWGLPQNVFYVRDAAIGDIDYGAKVIRGVQNCVAQMNDNGVVTMLGYSVAAGCTTPNFIIRPNYTGAGANFRDDAIRRPPFYQFDLNFAKTTMITDRMRLQLRFELFNVFNQSIYDERQYENNPTNPLFGTVDKSVVRQSNFPRYGQLGIKLLF
ncbi:MAG: carboxypeptidase regulatory-like domain-containing protein [Acidobacteria bacterium]|nr:carboxypeptidase regulatory-like domain-containing protein [Acidobacteriota bacterium]